MSSKPEVKLLMTADNDCTEQFPSNNVGVDRGLLIIMACSTVT